MIRKFSTINKKIICSMYLLTNISLAFASSVETNLCIRNTTTQSHQIKVNSETISSPDWDGNSRPDFNFTLTIEPQETICRREEINYWSSTIKFSFVIDNGYEVPMKFENTGTPELGWYSKDRFKLIGENIQGQISSSGYSSGFYCGEEGIQGKKYCYLFKLI